MVEVTNVTTVELTNIAKHDTEPNFNKEEFATYLQNALGADCVKVKHNKMFVRDIEE